MPWASQVALVVKNLPVSSGATGDLSSIPGLERFPGRENGNLLQYFALENPMDRGTWRAIVYGVAESDTTEATWQEVLKSRCLWRCVLFEGSRGESISFSFSACRGHPHSWAYAPLLCLQSVSLWPLLPLLHLFFSAFDSLAFLL